MSKEANIQRLKEGLRQAKFGLKMAKEGSGPHYLALQDQAEATIKEIEARLKKLEGK